MSADRIGPSDRQRELADINFKSLSVFMIVADERSMVRATKRLGIGASGISQQISNLEAALGVKLFDRSARPIALTPAGILLRHHAERIIEVVGRAQAELLELSVNSLPEFRVGIIDDLDTSVTPDLVSLFQATHPQCLISASTGRSDHLIDAFKQRKLDVVVSAQLPADTRRLDIFPILREPFVLVTVKGDINAHQPVLDQLLSMPFVGFSNGMPLGRLVNQQLKRVGLSVDKRVEFDATRAVLSMVLKSRGWTVLTPLCILDSPRCIPELEFTPLPFAGFTRHIWFINRAGELGSLPSRLAEQCRALIKSQLLPQLGQFVPFATTQFQILKDSEENPMPLEAPLG